MLFGHIWQVFVCTYSYMGSDTAMYEILLFLLLYPAYECVACFVLWNCIDVNRNTIIILRAASSDPGVA